MTYCYDMPGMLYSKVQSVWRPSWPSILCLDAGHANNSFSLVGGHFDFTRQKTVVTTVIEIMTHDDRRIDFNGVYENVIRPVAQDINAVVLLADQWQSLDILSRAQADLGVIGGGSDKPRCAAKQHSPRRKDFDSLVAMLENNSMELPFLSKTDYDEVNTSHIEYRSLVQQPMKHLFLQMLTVRDAGVGKCPEKGEGFTDDIFRALVLMANIHHPKIMERLNDARSWPCFGSANGRKEMPKPVFAQRGF
jgi:hypothetical protein